MREQDELTTVATFSTRAEADLAQERLSNEGVEAFVLDEMTSSLMPYLTSASGIRLQVPTEQVDKAREVLGVGAQSAAEEA
jgi:putative signal transducing protein